MEGIRRRRSVERERRVPKMSRKVEGRWVGKKKRPWSDCWASRARKNDQS